MLKLNRNGSEECSGVRGFCVLEVSHGELAELTTVEPFITDGLAPCLGVDPFDGCRDNVDVQHGILLLAPPAERGAIGMPAKMFQSETAETGRVGADARPDWSELRRSKGGLHEMAMLQGDAVCAAVFDGSRIIELSGNNDAQRWKAAGYELMSTEDLITEVCTRHLSGLGKLSRDEMRLAGLSR
jgi:hypothetical protein